MKRNRVSRVAVAIGFLLLLVATAAGSVGAFPSQTNECGTTGCHDTLGTLTIASNSTSMSATTGEPFALLLDAGNGADWIAIRNGWADNSQFLISVEEVEDGSANDTNTASGAISVEVTFTPLSSGDLTIRIWTAAGGDLASSLDITVTVTGESITTTTPPPNNEADLLWTWRIMMIILPVSVGVVLLILGFTVFKRRS
ncbi:MAG: hypothetical protein OEV85_01895 [Candidatus Thorarchaeota archaeon]|nr:hypothetical protein [Candidatus Thorarchaeota archaeon]